MLLAAACALLVAAPPSPVPASPAPAPTPSAAALPAAPARPGDVDTIEHAVAALYDVISGPPGGRDWDRFRALFHPEARMIPSGRAPDGGGVQAHARTPEEYVQRSGAYFAKNGFFERGVKDRVERFDHMAHVWSTYESRHAKDDPQPFARGINSIQLLFDGTRWWILTVYWQPEEAGHPLPPEALPNP